MSVGIISPLYPWRKQENNNCGEKEQPSLMENQIFVLSCKKGKREAASSSQHVDPDEINFVDVWSNWMH